MIKRCSILFLVLFYCTIVVQSQTYFSKRYPIADHWGGGGISVIENNIGYFSMTPPISTLTGKRDLVITQTDFEGNILFEKIYGDTTFSYYTGRSGSLQKVVSGGYVMFGAKQNSNKLYNVLYRFNDVGDTLWTKQVADTTYDYVGDNMKVTPDGGFICIGDRGSPSAPISVIKTDSLGNKQWEKFYGGTTYDKPTSIALCSDGGYVYCTTTKSGGVGLPNYNIRVMKIDSLGNMMFNKFYGDVKDDGAGSIMQTQDGGYVVVMAYSIDTTTGTRTYASLLKLNSLGDLLWLKKVMPIKGNGPDSFQSVLELSDGSFVVAGQNHYTDSIAISRYHGLVAKITATGDLVWQKEHQLSSCNACDSYLYDIRTTSDGGFICSGVANSPQDMWLLKLDSLGCADTTCSLATGVKQEILINHELVNIYPNPANSFITVESSSTIISSIFRLIDITGKEVLSRQINSSYTQIDIQGLSKGIYFYQITNKKDYYSGKLVVH